MSGRATVSCSPVRPCDCSAAAWTLPRPPPRRTLAVTLFRLLSSGRPLLPASAPLCPRRDAALSASSSAAVRQPPPSSTAGRWPSPSSSRQGSRLRLPRLRQTAAFVPSRPWRTAASTPPRPRRNAAFKVRLLICGETRVLRSPRLRCPQRDRRPPPTQPWRTRPPRARLLWDGSLCLTTRSLWSRPALEGFLLYIQHNT